MGDNDRGPQQFVLFGGICCPLRDRQKERGPGIISMGRENKKGEGEGGGDREEREEEGVDKT